MTPPPLARAVSLSLFLFVALIVVSTDGIAQTRIMPLGDSITSAESGHASYRYWLWHLLEGVDLEIDFVGTKSGVHGGSPLYEDFDQDHEGHWGWRADEVKAHIGQWVNQTGPQVVLIHLGHNDLSNGQGVMSTVVDLEGIIDEIRTVNPEITVLIAKVIPSSRPELDEIPALNWEIGLLALRLHTADSRVIAVDHWTEFDPDMDTYDGVHPNEAGERKISQRWFAELVPELIPTGTVFNDGFDSGDTAMWSTEVGRLD